MEAICIFTGSKLQSRNFSCYKLSL